MGPKARSIPRPIASSLRSVPLGASNSIPTGKPDLVSPAGRTRPGIPAVLPGEILRPATVKNDTFLPRISTVSSCPIGGAGAIVVGNTIAATLLWAK